MRIVSRIKQKAKTIIRVEMIRYLYGNFLKMIYHFRMNYHKGTLSPLCLMMSTLAISLIPWTNELNDFFILLLIVVISHFNDEIKAFLC